MRCDSLNTCSVSYRRTEVLWISFALPSVLSEKYWGGHPLVGRLRPALSSSAASEGAGYREVSISPAHLRWSATMWHLASLGRGLPEGMVNHLEPDEV